MPVKAVRSGADFVEIDTGDKIIRVTEADVSPGSKEEMANGLTEGTKKLAEAAETIGEATKVMSAPKEIIKDKKGNPVGIRSVQ